MSLPTPHQKVADQINLTGLRVKMRTPNARGPLGRVEELNRTLRRLYYDGKGVGDERGKAFWTVGEKVVPHLTREASGWRSMILSRVLRLLPRRWEWICSGTWDQSRRSVGF